MKCLWPAFYRVNVFVGGDTAHATIANSYFVRTGPDGHILNADPAITMQYAPPEAGGRAGVNSGAGCQPWTAG